MKFGTTLLQSGKTAVGIQVPDDIVETLGVGKRPPVRVTINGYTYRNTIAVMGGAFMVGVSAEHRDKAHLAGWAKAAPAAVNQLLDQRAANPLCSG